MRYFFSWAPSAPSASSVVRRPSSSSRATRFDFFLCFPRSNSINVAVSMQSTSSSRRTTTLTVLSMLCKEDEREKNHSLTLASIASSPAASLSALFFAATRS